LPAVRDAHDGVANGGCDSRCEWEVDHRLDVRDDCDCGVNLDERRAEAVELGPLAWALSSGSFREVGKYIARYST
jgi:hypothetical protein